MCTIHIDNFLGKNVHFIGIGGISMSALAEILLSKGYKISGSDLTDSNLLKKLADKGAVIHIGHHSKYAKDADLVVYTAAVKHDNPEMQYAIDKNIPILQRAELLGQIMQTYPLAIGIAGSHGKTTATSMLAMSMVKAGLDPTVLVGGELNDIGGNVRIGKSQCFITEACEYVGSFLSFYPNIAVILNIDLDHLDYFRDIDHIYETFLKFAKIVPDDGYVVGFVDDPLVAKLLGEVNCKTICFGYSQEADLYAESIDSNNEACYSFNVIYKNQCMGRFDLQVPGKHNINNALASIATIIAVGVHPDKIREALYQYKGTKRRFEYKGSRNGVEVIDDYAHHPAEISATLSIARSLQYKKLWCVFQPHTYTRTKKLFNEFVAALKDVDSVIVTDIYSAREKDTHEIHSKDLSDAISKNGGNCIYISDFDEIVSHLKTHTQPGDLVLTMGAGDVHEVGERFLKPD